MKIVVADKISPHGVELLSNSGFKVSQPAAADLARELADADALIVRSATHVTEDVLSHAPKLRIVGRAGVGVDNIELDAATRRGVLVVNTPGSSSTSVAEHALALMMSLARSIPQLNAAMHAGRWEKSSAGAEMRGKTLGLVGLGRIGAEVARRARALEIRVVAYDPYLSPERAAEWGVELLPLPEMLGKADYVSLHTALSPATERIVNAGFLAQMKRGARLVNTARGELVDEAALADALRSGHLAGAGLDVFTVEPPKDSPLLAMSNVIATPHVAGSTAEAQEEVGVQIAQQVRDYLAEGAAQRGQSAGRLAGTVSPPAAVSGTGRASGLSGRADRAFSRGTPAHRLRAGRGQRELGHAYPAQRRVGHGVLNGVLSEHVNLVNAPARAAERGLNIEEATMPRARGIADVLLEIMAAPADREAEGRGFRGRHGALRHDAATAPRQRNRRRVAARRHAPLRAQS